MTKSAHQIVAEMSDQKRRNLDFLNRYFPNIGKTFANRELVHSRLNVDPATGGIDLLVEDKALYNGNAEDYNAGEAEDFSKAFKVGSYNQPLRHSYVGEFHSGRFFHGSLEKFLGAVGAIKGTAAPYLFHESLPCVVFFGCGFGWHVSKLIKLRDVQHAVLVEHDPDKFLASLYVTDWEAIIQPYIDNQKRSFVLSVGDTTDKAEEDRVKMAFAAAWNAAIANVPFMPIQTVLYVHQADPFYTKAANRFNQEIEPFINVWGYYDDEVNQLNHVLHNLEQGIPVLKKIDLSTNDKLTLICGNGPSLNGYLEIIKKNRDKLNVISAGSTTYTLLMNHIYPDAMVTVESDLATYNALKILPKERACKVPIIGAAQIHPYTFGLFSDGLVYMKQETAYAQVFGEPDEQIASGTPSATNAALAIVLDLKLPNVFLVGLDFGFKFASESHAEGSFYYDQSDNQAFSRFKENISKEAYYLEENRHGKIYTTPFYNTGRIHAQRKITEAQRADISNLSLGATIDKTTFQDKEYFLNKLADIQAKSQESLFEILKKQSRVVESTGLLTGTTTIHNYLKEISSQIRSKLKDIEPNLNSIEQQLFLINEIASGHKAKQKGSIAMFVRGTVWHWMFNYYALVKSINRQDQIETLTNQWKTDFSRFLRKMPQHFKDFTNNRDSNDPKLNQTISDPEPNIEKWLSK